MLKHLFIKNFVLIDELELDFHSGFSVFTGETGAGKSILIDAISLLSAERASTSFVMKGKEKAIIEGTFALRKDSHAARVLEEAGFEQDEEHTFTREISASGKTSARIDHRIVTLSLMRDCLKNEIDIHGQRDNAYLLNTANHVRLLDAYISQPEVCQAVRSAYEKYDALQKEKESALQDTYNESDLEFFRYQLNEIESASLQEGEEEALLEKEKQYKSVKESFERIQGILSLYDESVSSDLYEIHKNVSHLPSGETMDKIAQMTADSYYSLSEAMDLLRGMIEEMDLSEEEIDRMEERLYTIQKLKRKYGRSYQAIMEKKEELETQIERIAHRQEYLDQIDRKIAQALHEYEQKAAKLSSLRKKKAPELDHKAAALLKELMLDNADFHTEISEKEPSASGSDRVEFLIRMNKGEDLKPLSKTASGGEHSRLMLGLKVIFTKLQGIETVIFDEIDTGVSGPVATAIGRKMHQLSETSQVFSVTHLAQVAACADTHYFVLKKDDEARTRTSVSILDHDGIIHQLALIASGEATDTSLKAAEELYRRNHS